MADRGGTWIADQLALHRIPQKDLAAALGVDPSAITRLLRGARKLKESEIAIAQAFFSAYGQARRLPPPNLLRALSVRGVALADVSKRSGVGEARLLEIKLGQGEAPSEDEQERIAGAFGQDPVAMFEGSGANAPTREALSEGWRAMAPAVGSAPAPQTSGRIPVYRALPSLGNGCYAADFVLAERVEAPLGLRGVPGAFGVFVSNAAASPLVLPGDVYFVNPGRPVLDGDRALARLDDGTVTIGEVRVVDGKRQLVGRHLLRSVDLDGKGVSVEAIVGIWGR